VPVKRAPTITVKAEGADRESGIADVLFFWGRPVEGKFPANTQPVRGAQDDEKAPWSAIMPLGDEKKGSVDLTAQFTNGVGLVTFTTVTVEIVEPPPPMNPNDPANAEKKKGPGKIVGKVVEGGRPQPGLVVTLSDDKGMPKLTTKTGEGGVFEFPKLEPGTYKLSSTKEISKTKGETTVTVQNDATTPATIELLR
jgi:hypothetical protein